MNKEEFDAPLLEHEADGIKELDNLLPRWWVWLFYLCIAFAVVYMTYYHVLGKGALQIAEYEAEMAVGDAIKSKAMAEFESTMASREPSTDEIVLARGREIFVLNCAPCHRDDGGGLVGPNFTDDYFIHGPAFADSLRVIWNGVPEKGMVSWKSLLKPPQILDVASYIHSLRGKELATPGKPPENQAPVDTGPSEFE